MIRNDSIPGGFQRAGFPCRFVTSNFVAPSKGVKASLPLLLKRPVFRSVWLHRGGMAANKRAGRPWPGGNRFRRRARFAAGCSALKVMRLKHARHKRFKRTAAVGRAVELWLRHHPGK